MKRLLSLLSLQCNLCSEVCLVKASLNNMLASGLGSSSFVTSEGSITRKDILVPHHLSSLHFHPKIRPDRTGISSYVSRILILGSSSRAGERHAYPLLRHHSLFYRTSLLPRSSVMKLSSRNLQPPTRHKTFEDRGSRRFIPPKASL